MKRKNARRDPRVPAQTCELLGQLYGTKKPTRERKPSDSPPPQTPTTEETRPCN